MISLCFPLEIAALSLWLSRTSVVWGGDVICLPSWQNKTLLLCSLAHIYMFFFPSTVCSCSIMSVPTPAPNHLQQCPTLWSEILTASTQSLSMKGQLFPALCRPAQASVRRFPLCLLPPLPKFSQTHTDSQGCVKAWNAVTSRHQVTLRGHGTKLCPHC